VTTIKAEADPAMTVRLESKWASIARGSSRIGALTSREGQPPRRDHMNRTMNANSASA
jgi:hypothetical protein